MLFLVPEKSVSHTHTMTPTEKLSRKRMGIDYGTKRVGVALTDESGLVATPEGVYPNDPELVHTLRALIEEEGVVEIVMGESKNNQGTDNQVMKEARDFAHLLSESTGVPVQFEPEFYTSKEVRATRTEIEHRGETQRKQTQSDKTAVDAHAAAIILNSYIAKNTQ